MSAKGAALRAGDRVAPAALSPDTRVVGVHWSGDPEAAFTVETRSADGRWHRAEGVGKPDGGADPGSPDAVRAAEVLHGAFVSDPVSVATADRVRVRVEKGSVHDVEVTSVSSNGGRATGSRSGPVAPALAVSGLAVGALTLRGRRGLAVILVLVIGGAGALVALDVAHAPAAQAAGPGQPGIVTRDQWGADESLRLGACPEGPQYAVPRIAVIHHTDGANGYSQTDSPAIVRGLYTWFIQARGYCDMAYNFLIDKFGTVYEGRFGGMDKGVVGAHATDFNTGTVGVSLMGSYSTLAPSGVSTESLISFLAWKMSVHRMNPYAPVPTHGTTVDPIIGHRDAGALSGDPTSCPGQAAYDLLPAIRDRVRPQVDYGTPIGNLESALRPPGSVRVSGWAIDPDTTAPITVHAYVDGMWGGAFSASGNRPDVGAVYSWLGSAHGFDLSLPVGFGSHQVCIYAINAGPGSENPLLGCATPQGAPVGNFESAARGLGSIRLTGWAVDPDAPNPLAVHVYSDGSWGGAFSASSDRPDVGAAFPGYGASHGFDITVPFGAGTHQICVYAINIGPAAPNSQLGCQTLSGAPRGNFDVAVRDTGPTSIHLIGWGLDPDTANPITVHLYVDGGWGGAFSASSDRPDVGAAFPGYGSTHGFDVTVPFGPGPHQICAYAINVGPADPNTSLGCQMVLGTPRGHLESAARNSGSAHLTGWALDPDTASAIAVHVYIDGAWGGAFSALGDRPDVGAAFPGYGATHGFDVSVPVGAGDHQVCVYAINVGPAAPNPQLGCRTV